jgi:hypothetical protein
MAAHHLRSSSNSTKMRLVQPVGYDLPAARPTSFGGSRLQGWVEQEMRMSLMHKQLPSFVAAHPANRDLPPMRADSTRIGVRRGGSRK